MLTIGGVEGGGACAGPGCYERYPADLARLSVGRWEIFPLRAGRSGVPRSAQGQSRRALGAPPM